MVLANKMRNIAVQLNMHRLCLFSARFFKNSQQQQRPWMLFSCAWVICWTGFLTPLKKTTVNVFLHGWFKVIEFFFFRSSQWLIQTTKKDFYVPLPSAEGWIVHVAGHGLTSPGDYKAPKLVKYFSLQHCILGWILSVYAFHTSSSYDDYI